MTEFPRPSIIGHSPALRPHGSVYLAGTITPDPAHLDWRLDAECRLFDLGIQPLNPVRGKNPSDWTPDGLEAATDALPYSNGGFVARDLYDIQRADVVLINLCSPLPQRQSVGTLTEFGFAVALRKPIVVASDVDSIRTHPFVVRLASKVVSSLDEALQYVEFLLS